MQILQLLRVATVGARILNYGTGMVWRESGRWQTIAWSEPVSVLHERFSFGRGECSYRLTSSPDRSPRKMMGLARQARAGSRTGDDYSPISVRGHRVLMRWGV